MGRNVWTKQEEDYVIENYQDKTNKEIASKLKRTEDSIKSRARKLGLRKVSHYWKKEEDNVIRQNYPKWGVNKCLKELPSRTRQAIHKRAQILGIKCNLIEQRKNLGLRTHDLPKGCYISSQGYVVYTPTGRTEDRVYLHRYIMEKHLGRELSPDEIVHHKDEDKLNNNITNLEVMTRAEHAIHHHGDLSGVRDSPTP